MKFEMDAVSNAESIMGKDPLVEWRKERSRMLKERTKVSGVSITPCPSVLALNIM